MDFKLDPFQEESLNWIKKDYSVLVSAPTGSGKTLIAEAAIKQAFSQHKKAIYTAPIKALSNQKYRDFRKEFGEDKVGILTGDVSINPDAEIVIMTTEIYRNRLFDESEYINKTAWVIFDEVHYLDDAARGTVWEEALLFTPDHINILALSATVPNVKDLADWIKSIHNREIKVVQSDHRPVPLEFIYQCQNKFYTNPKLLRKMGYFGRDSWKLSFKEKRKGMRPMRGSRNRFDSIWKSIESRDHLPAIYFAFGRKKTEQLAWDAIEFNFLNKKESEKLSEMFHQLLKDYDLEKENSALDMLPLLEHGIAYHHAGMLPSLKEVIEQLFTSRLIKLIFTTETFALGINMPARCVIFDELEKYSGSGFNFLSTRDFYQMAGRAGRRGLDDQGTVYVRVAPNYVPFREVERIIYGQSETVHSQLNAAYATVLNLYKTLGDKLLEIYPRTFHAYQSSQKKQKVGKRLLENKLALLDEMGYLVKTDKSIRHSDPSEIFGGEESQSRSFDKKTSQDDIRPVTGLTAKGEFAASLFGYELPLAEMQNQGVLERFDEVELNILLSGMIYEPRKGDAHPRLIKRKEKIRKTAEHFARSIHRKEHQYHIQPYTKPPHFNMAPVVEAWTNGATFDDLAKISSADEGGLVRHFRMIIQLLRELLHAPHISETLRARARQAMDLINRDVVDAERQLRN